MVLQDLTLISVILLVGLLSSMLANKLRTPDVFVLVIVGIILGVFNELGWINVTIDQALISGLGLIALILIVFEATAKLTLKEVDVVSIPALKITLFTVIANLIILAIATSGILFGFKSEFLFISILFAALMCGTSADIIMQMMSGTKSKLMRVLEVESIINTPLTVLLPLIIVQLQRGVPKSVVTGFTADLLLQITSGLGAGLLVGLIVFKAMHKKFSEKFSPIAVITAVLLAYVLAENINGNGIIAVTTLGLFFGNLDLKNKQELLDFESGLSTLLKVIIFVIIGVIIKFPLTLDFILRSLLLFLIYLFGRFFGLLPFSSYSIKERVFMTLSGAKGLAVVVVTLILASQVAGFDPILDYILAFVLYSIIFSTIAIWLKGWFLGKES